MAQAKGNEEIIGGILLAVATALALLVANSPMSGLYDLLLSIRFDVGFATAAANGGDKIFEIDKPIALWINDGLMAIFFFLVGMEIKRELKEGSLANPKAAALPVIGAIGGVAVPALIYMHVNLGDEVGLRGWAIPMATDIAFAVAIAASLGRAVPPALKAFLLALAIIDDLIAIVVIALFYTAQLSQVSLILGFAGVAGLAALNVTGVRKAAPYVLVGIFTWACVLKSGVHATLAGVALGFAMPLDRDEEGVSLLEAAEHGVKPWVTWLVLPLFAFANAGVSFTGMTLEKLTAPIPLGITLGLFVGKQLGVFAFAWAALRLGIATMPRGATMLSLYGVSVLTGIGFTMSLFIGSLAFDEAARLAEVRLGVLIGSLLSTLMAFAILFIAKGRKERASAPPGAAQA
jgi:NhaA family Na+:H+ antiporter